MKRSCKRLIKKNLELKKGIERKGNRLYVKWKGYNNSFNSWIDKKYLIKLDEYFFSRSRRFRRDIKVKLDLSNYATKTDLKTMEQRLI